MRIKQTPVLITFNLSISRSIPVSSNMHDLLICSTGPTRYPSDGLATYHTQWSLQSVSSFRIRITFWSRFIIEVPLMKWIWGSIVSSIWSLVWCCAQFPSKIWRIFLKRRGRRRGKMGAWIRIFYEIWRLFLGLGHIIITWVNFLESKLTQVIILELLYTWRNPPG